MSLRHVGGDAEPDLNLTIMKCKGSVSRVVKLDKILSTYFGWFIMHYMVFDDMCLGCHVSRMP